MNLGRLRNSVRASIIIAALVCLGESACTFDTSGLGVCHDSCRPDTMQCGDSIVQQCVLMSDGCYDWNDVTDCDASGLVCVEDGGSARCTGVTNNMNNCTCTPGERACSSDGLSVFECRDATDGGSCAWEPVQSCGSDEVCRQGQCVDCHPCVEGDQLCLSSDTAAYQICDAMPDGCTEWHVQHCQSDSICDSNSGTCVQCSGCTAGDKICSGDGFNIMECKSVDASCMGYVPISDCSKGMMEFCDSDATEVGCRQFGDTCDDAFFISGPTRFDFSDFGDRFSNDSTRDAADALSENASFPIRWAVKRYQYRSEAFFGMELTEGQVVRISSEDRVFLWSMTENCEEKAINFQQGTLVFGAPWTGRFVFGVEPPSDATRVTVTVEDATTVCDVFGSYDDGDNNTPFAPVTVSASSTVCLPVRRYGSAQCVRVSSVPDESVLMAWTTDIYGKTMAGPLQLTMYDSAWAPIMVHASAEVSGTTVNSFPEGDVRPAMYYLVESGSGGDYWVCMSAKDNGGGAMPYAALHIMVSSTPRHPQTGEVIFSEVMFNAEPAERNWIELSSAVENEPLLLADCEIDYVTADGSVVHTLTLPQDTWNIVLPGAWYMISASHDARNAYLYTDVLDSTGLASVAPAMHISKLVLRCQGQTVDEAILPVDEVYDATNVSFQIPPGSDASTNDSTSAWCPSYVFFSTGSANPRGTGTPRSANVPCDPASLPTLYEWDFTQDCTGTQWRIWQHNTDEDSWEGTSVQCVADGVQISALPGYNYRELGLIVDLRGDKQVMMQVDYEFSPSEERTRFMIQAYRSYRYYTWMAMNVMSPLPLSGTAFFKLYTELSDSALVTLIPSLSTIDATSDNQSVLVIKKISLKKVN